MDFQKNILVILNSILTYSFDEIFVTDASGNILFTSEKTEKMFGILHEEINNQTIFELEERGIFSPSIIAAVLNNQQPETFIQETIQQRKVISSGYPIFDEADKLIGALSFSRDITEFEYLKKENEQVAKLFYFYQEEMERLKRQAANPLFFNKGKMKKVLETVSKVADFDVTVLLSGESGVGKNRIAQTIHQISKRKNECYIEVNCGAIPESLIESELFGYEEGAFTGAKKGGKKGYFETAGKGTLLLDEIGELPLNLQVKLLSVLQNQSLMRIGGSKKIELECRIICATNQNLEEMIQEKNFREDLYYRINVINIFIPPLRERREEMVQLILGIMDEMNGKYKMKKEFTPAMIAWLTQQTWPGNIRELKNYIERRMVTSSKDEIDMDSDEETCQKEAKQEMTLQEYLDTIEKEYIIRMYQKYPSSIKLGEKLGISQSTANRKIRKYIGGE